MNDQPNPPPPSLAAAPLPAYKDRSTGLTVFGILTILLGGLCGLLVPLMLASLVMPARNPQVPVNALAVLPVVLVYGLLAVALIWLGIGSLSARRWARALLLIFSWTWLIMGVFMTAIMPFFMGTVMANLPPDARTGKPALPPEAIPIMIAVMVVFFGVFFIVMPAVWVFFYSSRHVKATCEARDPVPGWTDACPLPVLGFVLWTAAAVPMMLILPLTGRAVMPCFGQFITGLPCGLFCLAVAVVWGLAAWWLYRLDVRGWWLILIAMVLFMVSGLLTYAHHDISELYQLQGLPPAQIDQIQKLGLFTGNRMGWFTALCSLPLLGYLLFIKKYLRTN